MSEMTRRALRFNSIDEIGTELDRLLEKGYTRGGNWDLSQVALHLRDWLRFPIHGYPRTPLLVRPMLWMIRKLMGGTMLRKIIEAGKMPTAGATMSQTVHPSTGNDAAAVQELKTALEEWKNHTGPVYPSPLFGKWDYETATQLQLVHCSHHLGYLIPKG